MGGKYGDIAVDDLYVRENGCGFSPRKAAVYIPTMTPPLVITTTNPPIISGKCQMVFQVFQLFEGAIIASRKRGSVSVLDD